MSSNAKNKLLRLLEFMKSNISEIIDKDNGIKYKVITNEIAFFIEKHRTKYQHYEDFQKLENFYDQNQEIWLKAEQNLKQILDIDGCKLCNSLNEELEAIFENIIDNNIFKKEKVSWTDNVFLHRFEIKSKCICDSCLKYNFYIDLIIGFKNNSHELEETLLKYLDFKIALIDLQIGEIWINKEPNNFKIKGMFVDNKKKKVYFDQNVWDQYLNCQKFSLNVDLSRKDYVYYYSPSHLEEVGKWSNEQGKQDMMEKIGHLTNDLIVLPWSVDNKPQKLELFYENPYIGLLRVTENASNVAQLIEERRVLKNKVIKIKYKQFLSERHTKIINNKKNIFKEEENLINDILKSLSAPFTLKEVEKIKKVSNDYVFINDVIYKLCNCMDIIGFKKDNDIKRIKSSVHDIEHIIYAVRGDVFVTCDEKLYHRCKVIFAHIQPNIEVYLYNDFYNKVKQYAVE